MWGHRHSAISKSPCQVLGVDVFHPKKPVGSFGGHYHPAHVAHGAGRATKFDESVCKLSGGIPLNVGCLFLGDAGRRRGASCWHSPVTSSSLSGRARGPGRLVLGRWGVAGLVRSYTRAQCDLVIIYTDTLLRDRSFAGIWAQPHQILGQVPKHNAHNFMNNSWFLRLQGDLGGVGEGDGYFYHVFTPWPRVAV